MVDGMHKWDRIGIFRLMVEVGNIRAHFLMKITFDIIW